MLVVVEYVGKKRRIGLLYKCQCDCGKETILPGSQLRYKNGRISCGCYKPSHRKGDENPLWKGGRYVSTNGYVYVRHVGQNANKRGYALEHVAVMAKHIGRPLTKGETVHHLNGVKDDNRPENLELWSGNHHRGQRVSDLVEQSLEILRKYAPEKLRIESGSMLE